MRQLDRIVVTIALVALIGGLSVLLHRPPRPALLAPCFAATPDPTCLAKLVVEASASSSNQWQLAFAVSDLARARQFEVAQTVVQHIDAAMEHDFAQRAINQYRIIWAARDIPAESADLRAIEISAPGEASPSELFWVSSSYHLVTLGLLGRDHEEGDSYLVEAHLAAADQRTWRTNATFDAILAKWPDAIERMAPDRQGSEWANLAQTLISAGRPEDARRVLRGKTATYPHTSWLVRAWLRLNDAEAAGG